MRALSRVRCAAIFCLVFLTGSAFAATFAVNSTLDVVDANPGNGTCATAGAVCTLRAAVQEANALAGPDTITLPAGTYTFTIAGRNENAAATGDLDVTETLTINGGAGVTIDPNDLDRAFHLQGGAFTFSIDTMTILDGFVDPLDPNGLERLGAAIAISRPVGPAPDVFVNNGNFVSNTAPRGGAIGIDVDGAGGDLTIANSAFDGNTSTGDGGAIFYDTVTGAFSITDTNFGVATGNIAGGDGGAIEYVMRNDPSTRTYDILRGTFTNNQALDSEGGALYYCCGTFAATIVDATISGNTSLEGGGGIYTCCGGTDELTITNSTISGNQTTDPGGDGGGIDIEGDVTLLNTTIADNISASGGGVSLNGGTLTTRNALLGNNNTNCAGFVAGIVSQGGNLSSDTTCSAGFDLATDLNDVNPLLGPLADNGGPNNTHALLPGSPAINNAVAGAPATDQRGVGRPIGPASDIGSYEAAGVVLIPTTTTLESSANPSMVGQPVTFTATVTGAGGPPTGTVTFFDGAVSLGTVALSAGGTAQLTTSALAAGNHSITAQYNGDATFAGSTSAPLVQVVVAAPAGPAIPTLDVKALLMLAMMLAVMAMIALRNG